MEKEAGSFATYFYVLPYFYNQLDSLSLQHQRVPIIKYLT